MLFSCVVVFRFLDSIPTLLFVPMNGKPQMAQGAMPKASLKEAIDKVMLGK